MPLFLERKVKVCGQEPGTHQASQHQWEERTNLWTSQTLLEAWNRGRCLQRLLCLWKQPQGGIRNVSVKASTGVRVAPLELWVCWQGGEENNIPPGWGRDKWIIPLATTSWDLVLSSVTFCRTPPVLDLIFSSSWLHLPCAVQSTNRQGAFFKVSLKQLKPPVPWEHLVKFNSLLNGAREKLMLFCSNVLIGH